ncbi:MAG: hypothetical protein BKP49_05755 [Treponema sp. CETP13]|nr:MAG: hypothetical protein BKP49_05755 [Treponema sp. CETP13]
MIDSKAQSDSSGALNILIILFSAVMFFIVADRLVEIVSGFVFIIFTFSYWYSNHIKKTIKVRYLVPCVRINCGSSLQLELIVENKGRLPVFSGIFAVQTGSLAHPTGVDNFVLRLRSHERVTLRPDFFASERGLYVVGNCILKSSDPFGLFPFTVKIGSPVKIIVYPANYSSSVDCIKGLPQGKKYILDTAYQDVTQQRSVRNYLPGDEVRHINWRVSARFNSLYTNEFDNTLNEPCFVILNLTDNDYPLHLRHYIQEKAIRIAASLVKESVRAQQVCGFATTGCIKTQSFDGSEEEVSPLFIPPKKGSNQLILDKLACIKAQTSEESTQQTNGSSKTVSNELLVQTCLHTCKTRSHIFYVGPENSENPMPENYLRKLFSTQVSKFVIETYFCGDDQ